MELETLRQKLASAHYIHDETLLTTLSVALALGRPLLIEGAAGVGKTEIAKVMASALDRELVRLQCYEGLDESKALYEWNYQKQLLAIQIHRDRQDADDPGKNAVFFHARSPCFLRNCLRAGFEGEQRSPCPAWFR